VTKTFLEADALTYLAGVWTGTVLTGLIALTVIYLVFYRR
jgi:hypothetical protein